MVREDSPLRHPLADLSRRQVLVLDGLRYAADMADLAYDRLTQHLQHLAALETEPTARSIAAAMLDAWSIVDSSHRFRDLIANLPGLSNSNWKRLVSDRTNDVASLRDRVQHQLGELDGLIAEGGQLWGYLSWHELRDGRPTGRWHMIAAGAHHVGDRWLFIGPRRMVGVPLDRVRLNAFGMQVYLARTLSALNDAVGALENELATGRVRGVGPAAAARIGADAVLAGALEVVTGDP